MAATRTNSTIIVLMTHKLCILLGALSGEILVPVYNYITKSVGRISAVVNVGLTCGQRPILVVMQSTV